MSTHPLLCIRCKHYGSNPWAQCHRPLRMMFSLVTGDYVDRLRANCDYERAKNKTLFGRERCGPDGRFFEERSAPPPMQRGG